MGVMERLRVTVDKEGFIVDMIHEKTHEYMEPDEKIKLKTYMQQLLKQGKSVLIIDIGKSPDVSTLVLGDMSKDAIEKHKQISSPDGYIVFWEPRGEVAVEVGLESQYERIFFAKMKK